MMQEDSTGKKTPTTAVPQDIVEPQVKGSNDSQEDSEQNYEVRRQPKTAADSFMGRLDIGTVHHFVR